MNERSGIFKNTVWLIYATVLSSLPLFSGNVAMAESVAILGATIIDGNGGKPLVDSAIVIEGNTIVQLGSRKEIDLPANVEVINAPGKFIIPGFIDTNVHISGYFQRELFPLLIYGEQDPYLKYGFTIEGAQMALKYGVTTIRDSYGPLLPLIKVREKIKTGEVIGPRLLVAGNIIGWGGPASATETNRKPSDLSPLEEHYNTWFTQGTGDELTTMYPDEVRDAINAYIDIGPDFLKYGATTHLFSPVYIGFSPRVQRAIVETAHARGLKVDIHSSSVEGHLLAVDAGIDIITHSAIIGRQEFRPEAVKELCESNVYHGIFAWGTTSPAQLLFHSDQSEVGLSREIRAALLAISPDRNRDPRMPKPWAQKLREVAGAFINVDIWRRNQIRLIEGGCKIVIATDSTPGGFQEILGDAIYIHPDMGIGTILAIEGLVKLGMTEHQAIIAATKTGAIASGLIEQIGTLEEGKIADLLVLEENPLEDISNIRRISFLMHDGIIIDRSSLPVEPDFYRR